MAMDVGQTLLHNPEQTQLIVLWQSLPICRKFQVCGDIAPLRESVDEPFQRGMQSHFILQRWMKQIRYSANVCRNLLNELGVLLRASSRIRAKFRLFPVYPGSIHAHSSEQLPYSVM